jgi:uncharacterized membrane protein YbaN (DUF454 family)
VLKRFKLIGGVALLVAGVLGVILPIIPGTPLLLAAVAILGTDHPTIRPFIAGIRRLQRSKRGEQEKLDQ